MGFGITRMLRLDSFAKKRRGGLLPRAPEISKPSPPAPKSHARNDSAWQRMAGAPWHSAPTIVTYGGDGLAFGVVEKAARAVPVRCGAARAICLPMTRAACALALSPS